MTAKPHRGSFLVLALAAMPLHGHAETPAPRAETPIRQVVLSDLTRRYAVEITAGGTTIDAGLDTGSTGLCILSWALKPDDTGAGSGHVTYDYGAGTRISGASAKAKLTIAGLSGDAPVMRVGKVGCDDDHPHCPVEKLEPAQFGIQGNGLPDEGFKVILGVAMGEGEIPNPLVRMGVRRWIVELPLPGAATSGKLILNPTADDTAGFTLFHLIRQLNTRQSSMHDALEACLINTATGRHICGVGTLDTGANGLRILSPAPDAAWPKGTPVHLVFAQDDKVLQTMPFRIGQGESATMTMVRNDDMAATRLRLGTLPYFGFDVLYDPDHDIIGLRPR